MEQIFKPETVLMWAGSGVIGSVIEITIYGLNFYISVGSVPWQQK